MIKLLEMLNNTPEPHLILYSVVFLVSIYFFMEAVTKIFTSLFDMISRLKNKE